MIALLLILLISSCSKSEVVIMPPQIWSIDTTYTPRVKSEDTTKVKIGFEISITPWQEVEIKK